MEKNYPNWKGLPFEILLRIFQMVVAGQSQVNQNGYTHTCTAWEQPARKALYSDITIENLSQFRKFYNTVQQNVHLGSMAKVLNLEMSVQSNNNDTIGVEVSTHLTTLLSTYLPNLEILEGFGVHSYIPTMDALMDNQLKRLKRLEEPAIDCEKSEVLGYVTCVLLMKDRIENILISDDFCFDDGISSERLVFNRLYDKLHQFKNLTQISVERKTDDGIQVLEYVLHTCKSLEKISFCSRPSDEADVLSTNNSGISINTITKFNPRPNIKALDCVIQIKNYNFFLYIMQVFPRLQELQLYDVETNNLSQIDQHILSKLLHYLSKLVKYNVPDLEVNHNIITNVIEGFWSAKTKQGIEKVSFFYRKITNGNPHTSLQLLQTKHISMTLLSHTGYNIDWLRNNFLVKNGRFMMHISFFYAALNQEKYTIPGNFIPNALMCCPNLQKLFFQQCAFEQFSMDYSILDFDKRTSLNILSFDQCIVNYGMLNQLSLLLAETKQLHLSKIQCRTTLKQPSRAKNCVFEFFMPFTRIHLIVFGSDYADEVLYFKVFEFSHGDHSYFQYEPFRNIRTSTEEEYAELNDCKHFHICCQTIPDLQVEVQEDDDIMIDIT